MTALNLDALAMRRPTDGTGIQISEAFRFDTDDVTDSYKTIDTGEWFAVEIAVPSGDAALWGVAQWGVDVWSQADWVDITDRVRGITWSRGGTSDARAVSDVGDLEVTLSNQDGRLCVCAPDPIAPPEYLGAGTFLRCGVYAPSGAEITDPTWWSPQFAGFIESYEEHHAGANADHQYADRWVVVTAVETLSALAKIDEPERAPAGTGDTPWARLSRLVDDDFAFAATGYLSATPDAVRLQPTTMAGNRLSELYVLADSLDADLRSTRQGRIALLDKAFNSTLIGDQLVVISNEYGNTGGTYGAMHISYDADSLTIINDLDLLTNSINLARAGGTVFSVEDDVSVEHTFRSSYSRMDLAYNAATETGAAGWISSRMLARGAATYRPGAVTIDGSKSIDHLGLCITAEVGDKVNVQTHDVIFDGATIASYSHYIRPLQTGVRWLMDIEFGVSSTYSWVPNT